MAQAAIILREKRRKERRNTLQPVSVDDDDEQASTLQQHLQQIANLTESVEHQTANENKFRRVRFLNEN
jgi:hypothetical protein